MATQLPSQEVELYFPDLSRGRAVVAPPRSLTPDSPRIWRDSLNFIPRDGLMQFRPGVGSSLSPVRHLPPSVYALTPGTNGERPVFVYSSLAPTPQTYTTQTGGLNGLIPYRLYTQSSPVEIVVTNRQVFIYNDAAGAFVNVTPVYKTGSVSATNGSPNITGVGTAWATRGISPYQHINISGNWYQIYNVVDDTHIVLSANFSTATVAGVGYEIKRTWGTGNSTGADRSSLIFATVYNQTLIIAGTFLGRADGVPTPTVIQVSNILSATPTTTYLTSSFALVSGLDTIGITSISGCAVLPDSRIVVSGDQSTIYYSSNLVNTVWSVSPGGFVIAEHQSGAIHAMGWFGSVLTFHFETGIVVGSLTGQSDPPLNLQDSHSGVGCTMPMTMKEWDRRLYFMGFDRNFYAYDGNSVIPIGDDIKNDVNFASAEQDLLKATLFCGVNNKWGELTLYMYNGLSSTMGWTLTRDGSWWPTQFPCPIGAVSDIDAISGGVNYSSVGVYSLDGSTEKNMIVMMQPGVQDSIVYGGMSAGGVKLETDDLDLLAQSGNYPGGGYLTFKTPVSIVLWTRGKSATTDTISVLISRDGGTTWVDANHKTITYQVTGDSPLQFSFLDLINACLTIRVRITTTSTSTWALMPTRLLITTLPVSDTGLVSL